MKSARQVLYFRYLFKVKVNVLQVRMWWIFLFQNSWSWRKLLFNFEHWFECYHTCWRYLLKGTSFPMLWWWIILSPFPPSLPVLFNPYHLCSITGGVSLGCAILWRLCGKCNKEGRTAMIVSSFLPPVSAGSRLTAVYIT